MIKELNEPIKAFIQATNKHDTGELLAALTDDALISDEGQSHRDQRMERRKIYRRESHVGAGRRS